MRLDGPESSNFEDRTGQGGGGFSLGGGGGILGFLLPMILGRFGIVGILILALGYCALSSLGGGGSILGGGSAPTQQTQGSSAAASRLPPATKQFMTKVLGSTEQVWGRIFQQSGSRYTPTTLVAYSSNSQSGCGAAQSAMGPFYCPTDKQIYIDPSFFNELSQRFGAPGDFAQAYVIAHEVGHHVQDLQGLLDKASAQQSSSSEAAGNAVQVGIELQADCYAGVWAANATNPDGTKVLEAGDAEEGLKAAQAIGDDTLQQEAGGRVRPETFTHGTSAQRVGALRKGLETGDPSQCTYNQG
ncbi:MULTISPECIES: KPN_02809 family neutral zinc metallopeptidase [Sphingomonas]|uniref:KPN_02809 family neutral zinc metallopeptidase n=1 Tax=Sphingomonas TaxID=13687 RepID=UPI000DEEB027|nr:MULTISPECIES: neutral zinc metallopeptidase [Sphingomonas]